MEEENSIMEIRNIEEMMRASQQSNIFSLIPPDSHERSSAVRDSASRMSKLGADSTDRVN